MAKERLTSTDLRSVAGHTVILESWLTDNRDGRASGLYSGFDSGNG